MNVKPLPESYSWKGKLYRKGATQIPDDLAQALGLVQPPKESSPEPATEQSAEQQEEQTEPGQKTSSRRSKK